MNETEVIIFLFFIVYQMSLLIFSNFVIDRALFSNRFLKIYEYNFTFLQVQELAKFLVELWDLMEIPIDEQKAFSHVTRLISASVDEVSIQGGLSADVIEQVKPSMTCTCIAIYLYSLNFSCLIIYICVG